MNSSMQQMKEYEKVINSLQKQLAKYQQDEEENEEEGKGKKKKRVRSRSQYVNVDYLRNVLVKFLILSEYLTDDQIVLVPVLGSILRLGAKEKQMIDEAYNSNSYFMGANTLFPESANALPMSPKKKKKSKRKRK